MVADPGTTFTMSGGGALVPQALADLQKTSPSPSRVLTLALSSPTPGPYGTFASFAAAPVPFPPVDIWLDPPQAILLFSGTVNGVQFDSMTIPPFVPSGLPAAFQSVLLVNNRAEVSTPLVVVLD